jgi:hypothetical protein
MTLTAVDHAVIGGYLEFTFQVAIGKAPPD